MTNPMLEIDQVTIRFGAIEAVADATFSLGDDELLALIGPNGAGKTACSTACAASTCRPPATFV